MAIPVRASQKNDRPNVHNVLIVVLRIPQNGTGRTSDIVKGFVRKRHS